MSAPGVDQGGTALPAGAAPTPAQTGGAGRARRSVLARTWELLAVPVGAIILAMVVGSIVILASELIVGQPLDFALPINAYIALFQGAFGSFNAWVSTFMSAAPLMLAGLAVGVGLKAGLFNIGAQGQFLIGALCAAGVGGMVSGMSPIVAIPLAVLAGALGGLAYGFIPGALKAYTGAHEVVTTIMLNYIAIFILAYLVSGPLRAEGATFARTADVGNAMFPILLGRNGHLGILMAIAAIPACWWLLWRAVLGFEIRTVGANPEAARYAGIRARRIIVLTMALCGMLAGLAGTGEVLGVVGYLPAAFATTVGFDAIAVALLGRANPFGIFFAAILFGGMRAGAGAMQVQAGVPSELVGVLQGVILLFLAADVIVRKVFRIRRARVGLEELGTVTRSYGEQTAR
jgi:ABC-type uncharacterized transport system permease subunit